MKIELLEQRFEGKEEWNDFVCSHESGTPFHLTAWGNAFRTAFGHDSYYLAARKNGRICGVLPLTHIKSRLFGNVMSSAGFAAYGGILADDKDIGRALLAKAEELGSVKGVDYVELKSREDDGFGLPRNELYVTFIKELSADHDENMKAIPRKQRAMVRKGIGCGLKAHVGNEYLDSFYGVFAANVHRLGTPVYSKDWFKALLGFYGKDAEILVVEYEGKIISGVFSLYHRDTILPYYAGYLFDYRKYAPNDFQYWELMRRAVDRGCRFFDYGRSNKGTGNFNFKKYWGFEPQQLHYGYLLNKLSDVPQVNPLNPKYKRKIEAWRKLPLPLTKIIGPYIVKNIP